MTRKTGGPWRLGLPGSLEKRAWRGCARSLGKQIAKSIGVRFVKVPALPWQRLKARYPPILLKNSEIEPL
jgi:hypothetical protein